MGREQFLSTMQDEVLDTDISITMDTVLADIEEWDSLAIVSFIAVVNTIEGKKINRTAVKNATTVSDLYALLQ